MGETEGREQSLDEWCARLDPGHRVRRELTELRGANAGLRNECDDLRERVDALCAELKTARDEMEKQACLYAEASRHRTELKERLERVGRQCMKWQEDYAELRLWADAVVGLFGKDVTGRVGDIHPYPDARPLRLAWGKHTRDGGLHIEWHAPCGCAYHPEPSPHVHPCDEHQKEAACST